MALLQVLGVASILPFMQLVSDPDSINNSQYLSLIYDKFGFTSERSMLIALGFTVLGFLTVANIFSTFCTWLQHKYAWEVAHQLSIRLLSSYLNKPYSFFLQRNSSELLNNAVVEIVKLTNGVIIPFIELFARSLVVIVIFSLLIFMDPKLAFTVLVILISAYVLIYLFVRPYLSRLGKHRVKAADQLMKSLNEVLSGIKTMKTYTAEHYFFKRYKQASRRLIRIHPRVKILSVAPRYIVEIIALGGILAITIYLLIQEKDFQNAIPILSLYAFAGYKLLPALQLSFYSLTLIRHNFPIVEKLYDDLHLLESKQFVDDKVIEPIHLNQKIELKGVSYQYEKSSSDVLSDINLEIKKGDTIAFVGTTGSGKTSLIDIIVGLLDPTKGKYLIDDKELTPDVIRRWQQSISYVPQEVFLFDDSIKRNVAIGLSDDNIDLARVKSACKQANIHSFIEDELPEKYENIIGERGVRLSGGQRQRMGLARALYRNPSILILDEATSALDSVTENNVIESLKNIEGDLTIIIVAHRLSTVKHADKIYLLENGILVDSGTYDALFTSSQAFREMVELS